jgi:hypothetical protein
MCVCEATSDIGEDDREVRLRVTQSESVKD